MNGWRYLVGASIFGLGIAGGCSKTASDEPAGQSGNAGAAGSNGGKGNSAGAGAGTAGKGGNGAHAGSAGSGAGSTQGGSANAGAGGESEGGGGAASGGPIEAVLGELCPVESTIGVVQLSGFPDPYVQVWLHDRSDPWIGEPELSTSTCDYYHYEAGDCAGCEAGEVCSLAGACVPEPRTIKTAILKVKTGASERQYMASAELGGIYSTLDIGNASASYAMTLSWADVEVQLDSMPVASATLTDAAVDIEGDSQTPGALEATWKASQQGAFVRSRIPINHHAGGPTFTECAAPESAGKFQASAAMINPLAVVTGLEFQGLRHEFVAAAHTPHGCVEFRFGEQILIFPN
ncbi:MAG TPA: hypothetical protein VHP33_27210 [Polyangiaceae bacterium]|nr:hypothetical protein [Polyangiaceae bacterium]